MEPPDPKEDKLRLASELSGEEGHLEASAWVREFLIASRGAGAGGDSALLGSPSRVAKPSVVTPEVSVGMVMGGGDVSLNGITAGPPLDIPTPAVAAVVSADSSVGSSVEGNVFLTFLRHNALPIAVSLVCLAGCLLMVLLSDPEVAEWAATLGGTGAAMTAPDMRSGTEAITDEGYPLVLTEIGLPTDSSSSCAVGASLDESTELAGSLTAVVPALEPGV